MQRKSIPQTMAANMGAGIRTTYKKVKGVMLFFCYPFSFFDKLSKILNLACATCTLLTTSQSLHLANKLHYKQENQHRGKLHYLQLLTLSISLSFQMYKP